MANVPIKYEQIGKVLEESDLWSSSIKGKAVPVLN
jgi:hypothetical protein